MVEILIHLVEGAVIALLAIVNLQIKSAQTANKMEISEKLYEVKMDLATKHAENQRQIAVHSADDSRRFESIDQKLDRIDRKLDTIGG